MRIETNSKDTKREDGEKDSLPDMAGDFSGSFFR